MQSMVSLATGLAALSTGDAKAAIASFSACPPVQAYPRWMVAEAQEKSGDKAAALTTRTELSMTYRRDSLWLYVRTQALAAVPGKGA